MYADGGYDSKENFNYLAENGIEPVIKIRNNSSTKSRGSPSRAESKDGLFQEVKMKFVFYNMLLNL